MSTLGPDQVADNWSSIALDYERAFEKLTAQFSAAVIQQLDLQPQLRVLDVAAGTGSFSLAAAQFGCEVVATDFAPGMVQRLQQRAQAQGLANVRGVVMDGQNLQFADASFDVAVSIVGVIFFPDIGKGIAELKRVLKPGGRGVVVCWGEPEQFDMMRYLLQAVQTAVPDFALPTQTPVWSRLCGTESLVSAMQMAGFTQVEVTPMQGCLEIVSAESFWRDFTRSAPPLAKLFAALGEQNTRKTGEVFVDLVRRECGGESPSLRAQACIGMGDG